ncbi:Hypothetical predicted protein [Lecanosticta acicola]|uniref:Uncharacterized protein n=1 Tax=Lecanosticta acicola TaxID=111012 RepID=A0AAI8YZH1_9PEZI|nr:Hypothetical predicted protein [Lecanosticta acicola]
MAIRLPSDVERLLDQSLRHNFDNSKILAYKLQDVQDNQVQELCSLATESYAKEALGWPRGRLEKPEIFQIVENQEFKDVDACLQDFVQRLRALLEDSPPYEFPIWSRAFVVAEKAGLPERCTVVLLHKKPDEGQWKVDCVGCPVEVELGMTVTSLTMQDETEEDVVERLGG